MRGTPASAMATGRCSPVNLSRYSDYAGDMVMERVTASAVEEAVKVLRGGGLIALPTETVYGLAADARNAEAVRKIFETKGRPADHPLIVHVVDASALDAWAIDIPQAARDLARAFWPGPLTLVLRRAEGTLNAVTGGLDTVALRVPDHPVALAVLTHFGGGLAAPSANRYGRVSPTSAADVRADLGDAVECILDGGPCRVGIESTIVDLSGDQPRILRPGMITAEQIERVVGHPLTARRHATTRSPGLKPSHYAPRATVRLVAREDAVDEIARWQGQQKKVGLLAAEWPAGLSSDVPWLRMDGELDLQARHLYGRLREADTRGLEVVVVVPPEGSGQAVAVRDRLYRSAGLGDLLDDPAE